MRLIHIGFTNSQYLLRMVRIAESLGKFNEILVLDGPNNLPLRNLALSPRFRKRGLAKKSVNTNEIRPFEEIKREIRAVLAIMYHFIEAVIYGSWWRSLFQEPCLVHCQSLFLSPHIAAWLLYGKKCSSIISHWGSDVNRDHGLVILLYQKVILRRIKVLTLSGQDAAMVFYAKFGRAIESKIAHAFFPPDLSALARVCAKPGKKEITEQWIESKQFLPERVTIMIGNNGYEINQHLRILEQLAKLPLKFLDRMQLVIPLTYGGSDEYHAKIKSFVKQLGIPAFVPCEFLDFNELAEVKLVTDILLFLPEDDAYSTAVTEAFAYGTLVIAGSWLPYGDRKRKGLFFMELDKFSELGNLMCESIERLDTYKPVLDRNKSIIPVIYSENSINRGWSNVYDKAVKI